MLTAWKRNLANAKNDKNKDDIVVESTPLLVKDDEPNVETDIESAPMGYLGTAPPPAAPPPLPPPTTTVDEKQEDEMMNTKRISSSTSLSSTTNNITDDNASQSQLSTTQSMKSGKSKRRKKKSGSGDAASAKSSKSNKAKKKKRDGPQKSICHLSFDSVRYLAILASSMMLAMQIVPLWVLRDESTWLQISVRSYLAIFCFFFILTESNLPILGSIIKRFAHSNWILRGFLYSFIGLIGMEQDLAVKVADIAAAGPSSVLGPDYGTLFASLFMSITTWLMIAVGIIYTILGLLCMQQWYEKLEKGHDEKVKEWKQKKKREADFRKQNEEYRKYEKDRQEGRGEWYDDL